MGRLRRSIAIFGVCSLEMEGGREVVGPEPVHLNRIFVLMCVCAAMALAYCNKL